jgi:bifunctional non-homologous end joining protein LigD
MWPLIAPAPLTSLKEPIDHPNWLYELKHDGFRGTLYVDRDRAWFRSRKGNEMRRFNALSQQIRSLLKGQHAILDGEIVVLDEKGRSNFFDLMAHRGEPRYYAFDLLWLNGIDLRSRPLLERKRRLHRLSSKSREPLYWLFRKVAGRVDSRFTAGDIMPTVQLS